jgi:allophanate hydrolase
MTVTSASFVTAIEELYDRLDAKPLHPVWISMVPRSQALERAHEIEHHPDLPLAGKMFAVKDNFDVAGIPTTAGCPAFSYTPSKTATVVQRLQDAGALLIGKTNMDQFATGLVGTRSPFGACASVFNDQYISGGSSSGSAVAVAKGLVDFSLGSDTAGSGRVPAAFNGLIGLKPTRGLLSTQGLVPACRTLDCVSIFARTCREAYEIWRVARGFDSDDPFSRDYRSGQDAALWLNPPCRFGVPAADQLEFFGDEQAASLYQKAVARLEHLGGEKVEIDYSVFRETANLLYSGPWVSERLAAIQSFFRDHAGDMDPLVRTIIGGAEEFSAGDAFKAEYRLRELCREAEKQWAQMDVLFLPTTGTIYTHAQIAADPIGLNTNLGYYTNFVNLMDLAAIAVPGGFRENGLPFGVSFIGPAFSDEALLGLAASYMTEAPLKTKPTGYVELAVVGAHLSGQPLNAQLTALGGRLRATTRTAADYRLFVLPNLVPAKPGLVRDPSFHGPGIEVEVWAIPEDRFGTFVAAVPPPLAIGTIVLEDGESVKSFLCESHTITGALEISHLGGWRNYLVSSKT